MAAVGRQSAKTIKRIKAPIFILRYDSLLMRNPNDQDARRHATRLHPEDGRWKVERCRPALTIRPKLSWIDMHNSTTLDGYGYPSGIEYPTGPGMSLELYPRTGVRVLEREVFSLTGPGLG
jgi:hypothetical protein